MVRWPFVYPMDRYLTFDVRYTEQCEAGLIFWLIEELLDSQTVEGCRKVFDYLESRREINTAVFKLFALVAWNG